MVLAGLPFRVLHSVYIPTSYFGPSWHTSTHTVSKERQHIYLLENSGHGFGCAAKNFHTMSLDKVPVEAFRFGL